MVAIYANRAGEVFLTIILVLAVGVGGWAVARAVGEAEARQASLEAEWDAGKGRPEAITLTRDSNHDVTMELPKTIDAPVKWWSNCSYKSCKRWNIQHYPAVYMVGSLSQYEPNCFVSAPDNPVNSLKIASTRGGAYKFTYAKEGKRFTICAISPRQKDDKVVIWSDDSAARR